MSKEIGKSAEMLKNEARIEVLKKALKKERTTLKRLKTRLANTKEEITDIQRKTMNTYFSTMSKMMELKEEVVELLKKCAKFKGLSKDDQSQIDMLISELEETDGTDDEFEQFQEKANQEDFDDEQRAKMRDMFMEFQVKPDEKEQRNIRKVFIKLSTHFHPDKARNPKDKERFHTLMQQINQAYEQGDIEQLLEIEQLHLLSENIELDSKTITVDVLQQVIDRLERDLDFIKNQVTRTSAEIKQLRNSDLGNMLTEVKRSEKHGFGLAEMSGEMEEGVSKMEEMRDALKASVKVKNINPLTNLIMQETRRHPMADFLEEIGLGDMMDGLFEEDEEDEDDIEIVENPFFPIGSSIRVAENISYQYLRKINIKGWEGRVLKAHKDVYTGRILYEIQFDSITIKKWGTKKTKTLFNANDNFAILELPEEVLRATSPRDTPEEANTVYRTILHSIKWDYLGNKDHKLMQAILLASPEKTDIENWEDWFTKNKVFPTDATHRGFFNHKKGLKTKILGLYDWHEEAGFLVLIQSNGFSMDHPLSDLKIKGKHAKGMEMYEEWVDML